MHTTPFLVGTKDGFSSAGSKLSTKPATYSPMAGALVRPGDSIPATSINPGASDTSSIIKSFFSVCARRPAKDVIVWRFGRSGVLSAARCCRSSRPSAVVAISSLSSSSTAVGPSIRLPCTVGVTRTPFPYFVGSWKIVCDTKFPTFLSSRQYSPFRGMI